MSPLLMEWWLKTIQTTLNIRQSTKSEPLWKWMPMFQEFAGVNQALLQLWNMWSFQQNNSKTTFNWSIIEDAIAQSQKIYLGWMAMAMPIPLEKIENRIKALEEQAISQAQVVERLYSQISQGSNQIPESVSALQQLIEKQGREFHRLTDKFKAYVEENIDASALKK